MDTHLDVNMLLALLVIQRMGNLALKRITGMTLDELDELNYQRIMAEVH